MARKRKKNTLRPLDWRVGIPLIAATIAMLWLNVAMCEGKFGPDFAQGCRMWWGYR